MIIPNSEKPSCAEIRTSMNIEAIKKDTITFIHKRSTPHRVCGVSQLFTMHIVKITILHNHTPNEKIHSQDVKLNKKEATTR